MSRRAPSPPDVPKFRRRDATGHLDARYAADLRARSQEGATRGRDVAFLSARWSRDALAERCGESAVAAATSGGDDEDFNDDVVTEEVGGPFVYTTSQLEFAYGTDASNPIGGTREPFPRT